MCTQLTAILQVVSERLWGQIVRKLQVVGKFCYCHRNHCIHSAVSGPDPMRQRALPHPWHVRLCAAAPPRCPVIRACRYERWLWAVECVKVRGQAPSEIQAVSFSVRMRSLGTSLFVTPCACTAGSTAF